MVRESRQAWQVEELLETAMKMDMSGVARSRWCGGCSKVASPVTMVVDVGDVGSCDDSRSESEAVG